MIVVLSEPGGPDPPNGCNEQWMFFVENVLRGAFFTLDERAWGEEALVTLLNL